MILLTERFGSVSRSREPIRIVASTCKGWTTSVSMSRRKARRAASALDGAVYSLMSQKSETRRIGIRWCCILFYSRNNQDSYSQQGNVGIMEMIVQLTASYLVQPRMVS